MVQINKLLVSFVAVLFVISGERTYSEVRSDNYGTVFINIVSSYGFPLELKDGEIILTPKCSRARERNKVY